MIRELCHKKGGEKKSKIMAEETMHGRRKRSGKIREGAGSHFQRDGSSSVISNPNGARQQKALMPIENILAVWD